MFGRYILKHPKYEEAVDKLSKEFPRTEEVFRGAEWALARSPDDYGIPIPDIGVFRAHLECPEPMPNVHIYYTFDDRRIRFLAAVPIG